MKRLIALIAVCLTVAAVFLAGSALAYEPKDFYGSDVPEEEANSLIASLDLKLEHEDNRSNKLECFDVREDGRIAVGSEKKLGRAHISVYDADLNFLYGYSFKISGTYGLMWDGSDLAFFLVRGDIIFILNENAEVIGVKNASRSILQSGRLDETFRAAKHEVGGKVYKLGTSKWPLGAFATSYSTLSVTENGETRLLIDESRAQSVRVILICALVVLAVIAFVIYLVDQIKKNKASGTGKQ